MSIIRFNLHNSREGILTFDKDRLTCISDQEIKKGDILLHPQHSKIIDGNVFTFVIVEVEEERPSKGEWKNEPSIFRKCLFKKEMIPGKEMEEAGIIKTETFLEKGKEVKKAFFII